jgi:tRNA pseudouridine55 synthase
MARRAKRNRSGSGRSSKSSRPEQPGPAGFLVVDKPPGWTSHDVVDAARGWFGTRRVGHLGTLDPQATGVLPLAIREATKLVTFVEGGLKSYVGTVRLGIETDTLDAEGEVLAEYDGPLPGEATLVEALAEFEGDIEQIPPMFSAVKQGGVPLHRLARRGQVVERAPKKVRIHKLRVLAFDSPHVEIGVDCSAGTYVRTLAADLGERLGCGAHLSSLRRTRSGPFDLGDARGVDALEVAAKDGTADELLISPAAAMDLPVLDLPEVAAQRVLHGCDISPGTAFRAAPGARLIATDAEGKPLALMELRPDRRLWPLRVLATPAE